LLDGVLAGLVPLLYGGNRTRDCGVMSRVDDDSPSGANVWFCGVVVVEGVLDGNDPPFKFGSGVGSSVFSVEPGLPDGTVVVVVLGCTIVVDVGAGL